MKNYFETPNLDIIYFNITDIITTSIETGEGGLPILPGGGN